MEKLTRLCKIALIQVICIHLTLIPIKTVRGQSNCSYPEDTYLTQEKEKCQKDSSKEWSCKLNRCLMTGESKVMRDDFYECKELTNEKEQFACYEKMAKAKADKSNLEDVEDEVQTLEYVKAVVLVFLAVLGHTSSPKCTYQTLFNIAGYATVAGELVTLLFINKRLDKLEKKFSETKSNYENQLEAFEYLEREQAAIKKVTEQKSMIYTALTALYGAALAMSIYELMNPSCYNPQNKAKPKKTSNIKPFNINPDSSVENDVLAYMEWEGLIHGSIQSPSQKTYYHLKQSGSFKNIDVKTSKAIKETLQLIMDFRIINDFVLSDAHAESKKQNNLLKTFLLLLGGGAAGYAVLKSVGGLSGLKSKISGLLKTDTLGSPKGTAIISGICGAITLELTLHNRSELKKAKSNCGKIKEIISKLKNTMASYCPTGRDDISNPTCYCYLENGEQNDARSNSETCNKRWDKEKIGFEVPPETDYGSWASGTRKGCIATNGTLDVSCQCLKDKSKCLSISSPNKIEIGTSSSAFNGDIASLSNMANKMMKGDYSENNLSLSGTSEKMATKNRRFGESLLKKYNKKQKANRNKPLRIGKKLESKFLKKIATPKFIRAMKDTPLSKGANLASKYNSTRGTKGVEIQKALDKNNKTKLKNLLPQKLSQASKQRKKDSFNFDWGDDKVQATRTNPKKTILYDYQNNKLQNAEINKGQTKSIFVIISERVIKSGLARLFND